MARQQRFDAVVVGSGFGGSAIALALSRAGARVVVVERGRWVERDESAPDTHTVHARRRYQSESAWEVDGRRGRTDDQPNAAVGGQSVWYGGASLRFRERDFRPSMSVDMPSAGWPIAYGDIAPFYDWAEKELGVAGVDGVDPSGPPKHQPYTTQPPEFSTTSRLVAEAGRSLGLRPFALPLARNDLAVTMLPRAQRLGTVIRDGEVAVRLLFGGRRVDGVECLNLQTGNRTNLRAEVYVVSCGAIDSPALLIRSGIRHNGAAERPIGRFLMRHCSGIVIGVFPFRTNPECAFHKQVAFTDFCVARPGTVPPGPWGNIQSAQIPPPEYVLQAAPYPRPIAHLAASTLSLQAHLLCIAEDLPHHGNYVDVDRSRTDSLGLPRTVVFHRYHPQDLARRRALYSKAARILRRAGSLLRIRFPIHTYSHAVGTCRFGWDPASSVLDPWCGVHGFANLLVVDGSFMPTSGGVNPSLTIAANALRVGQHLVERWDDRSRGRGH